MDDLVGKLGFLSRNVQRAYPLEHTATRVDDTGVVLADSIIVDLSLRYDGRLGTRPFISYVSVTAQLCSCGIALETVDGPKLVAHVIAKKTDAWKTLTLIPLVTGVSGSITFGNTDPLTQVRFSTAQQSGLLPSAARPIPPGFLSSVQVGQFEELSGTVELRAGTGVTLRTSPLYATLSAPTPEATAILIGLDRQVSNTELLSACARRPESGNCGTANIVLPPVETINDIRVGCGRTINLEVINGTFTPGTGGLTITYTPTISQLCSDRVRNPNIAAVLEECQRPPVELVNCDQLPAYYDMKTQAVADERWQKNWFWQYGSDSYTLTGDGLQAATQEVEETTFVNMVGVYDSCGYRFCGDHVLELDVYVPPVTEILQTTGRFGVLLNYMQNAWLYSVLAGDAVTDPGLRVGLEVRERDVASNGSLGVFELWLCTYKNETEVINSLFVGVLREDAPYRYQLRIELIVTKWEREIPLQTLCRAQLFRLPQDGVFAPVPASVLETPLTFFGPYVGKYGVYADNTQFRIETFRLSNYVAV
jgi:hypothetical protein